ncbi:hypothetical protein J2S19_003072 [Metabacillus malikii]|uniref:Uncharacterized protein n=1 Tax=Metabacillus malikii TaxID=1504265 RepID=A0ABT9ZJ07_9BACI|nr:hypothetical protein [Metabacillus malikii]
MRKVKIAKVSVKQDRASDTVVDGDDRFWLDATFEE